MRIAFGLALVTVGAIGTLVPIVPGLALILAGIAVLGPDHRLSRALTRRWRAWSGKEELRPLEHEMNDDDPPRAAPPLVRHARHLRLRERQDAQR